MHAGYFQNILYPLQDKVLKIIINLPVSFYLTGGTALCRAYLHHRHSDDLVFFVNSISDFKSQVTTVIEALKVNGFHLETAVADEDFVRIFIIEKECTLKVDFVNDIPFRSGNPVITLLFDRTDNLTNILSNKLSALTRYSPKDVVDIVYICFSFAFNWETIMNDVSEKDIWINPVNAAAILESFPTEKLNEIIWTDKAPESERFATKIKSIVTDLLSGGENSLYLNL